MDIVDGLRLVAGAPTQSIGCLNCHSRMREAADEIERLRVLLKRAYGFVAEANDGLSEDIAAALAEGGE